MRRHFVRGESFCEGHVSVIAAPACGMPTGSRTIIAIASEQRIDAPGARTLSMSPLATLIALSCVKPADRNLSANCRDAKLPGASIAHAIDAPATRRRDFGIGAS